METIWRDDELLTVRGRYGGRRGRAPNGLLKALSKALWIFSSCLSCFFSLSTWIIGIANTIINLRKGDFQAMAPLKTGQHQWKRKNTKLFDLFWSITRKHDHTSSCNAIFLSLLEACRLFAAFLATFGLLPCIPTFSFKKIDLNRNSKTIRFSSDKKANKLCRDEWRKSKEH